MCCGLVLRGSWEVHLSLTRLTRQTLCHKQTQIHTKWNSFCCPSAGRRMGPILVSKIITMLIMVWPLRCFPDFVSCVFIGESVCGSTGSGSNSLSKNGSPTKMEDNTNVNSMLYLFFSHRYFSPIQSRWSIWLLNVFMLKLLRKDLVQEFQVLACSYCGPARHPSLDEGNLRLPLVEFRV